MNTLRPMEKLILVSSQTQVPAALRLQRAEGGTLLCFCTLAKARLDASGAASVLPDDLVALPDFNRIGLDNLARTRQVCRIVDAALQSELPFLKRYELEPTSAAFFAIKVFLDAATSSFPVLRDLLATGRPLTAFAQPGSWSGLLEWRRPLAPALLKEVFSMAHPNLRIPPIGAVWGPNTALAALKRLRCLASPRTGDALVLESGHDVPLVQEMFPATRWLRANDLCSGWPQLWDDIRAGLGVEPRERARVRAAVASAVAEAIRSREYREICADLREDLTAFLGKVLIGYLSEQLGKILPHAEKLRDALAQARPRFLLTAQCRLGVRSGFLLTLARSLTIPVVTYQEGGGLGYLDWPLFGLDAQWSDHLLVYGPAAAASAICRGRARVVPTGSLRLERIRAGLRRRAAAHPTIYLVLDIPKTDPHQHYPYNGGSFCSAYRHQLALLAALGRTPDVRFVIKTTPSRAPLYADHLPSNARLETKPLTEVLDDADAFILDFPSTTMQECLLTGRPMALLHAPGAVRFEPEARELLAKRIRICDDPCGFADAVQRLIGDARQGSDMVREEEFIRGYCVSAGVSDRVRAFFTPLLEAAGVAPVSAAD